MTATSPGDRVVTGAQLRAAREQLAAAAGELAALDCAGRVMSTVGFLLDTGNGFHLAELRAVLREVDTVDLALDLLTEAGLGCGQP